MEQYRSNRWRSELHLCCRAAESSCSLFDFFFFLPPIDLKGNCVHHLEISSSTLKSVLYLTGNLCDNRECLQDKIQPNYSIWLYLIIPPTFLVCQGFQRVLKAALRRDTDTNAVLVDVNGGIDCSKVIANANKFSD